MTLPLSRQVRHPGRWFFVWMVVMSLLGSLFASAPMAGAAVEPPLAFHPSGLDGAGFQNVVAIDPHGSGLVLAGGDVAGVHRSNDWGRTWRTSNDGLTDVRSRKVSSFAFSPSTPGKVYAAVGFQGAGGGFAVSTDGGQSWELRSTVPQFSGDNNNRFPNLPNPHPRSTGNLIAVDDAGGFVYAATFDGGLMRSADDGRTWATLGLKGQYLRGLGFDPARPNTIYVALYGDAVYKTTNARGAAAFTRLPSPKSVEELAVVGDSVYAAAGGAGVFASRDGGGSWSRLGSADVRSDGPVWLSIDAYRDSGSGRDVITAGATQPTKAGGGVYHSIMRSVDGGSSWAPLPGDPSGIHDTIGGPAGPQWWLAASRPAVLLGKGSYVAAQIVTDPADRSRILVAGRSGVWGSSDGGANWYPMVDGLGVTINKAIVADPNVPGRVFVANTDWVSLSSSDAMASVIQTRPPGASTGYALGLDTSTTPSTVYLGTGNRDTNKEGEVYSSPDPAAGWTSEGLARATGGKRPVGVAVGRVNGSVVILAAVEGSGIWRKSGGSWRKVNSSAMSRAQRTEAASFSWVPGSPVVYLYDHTSGVWRSTDHGTSWTRIWNKPSDNRFTGYVAADPSNPDTLYVSAADGVFRLDGAASGTVGAGVTAVRLGSFATPGPMTLGPRGQVFVAVLPTATASPGLSVSRDRGATWTAIDDNFYRSSAHSPYALAAGPEGNLYVSTHGTGVIVGSGGSAGSGGSGSSGGSAGSGSGGPGGVAPDTAAPVITVEAPTWDQTIQGSRVTITGTASDDRGVAAVRIAIRDNTTKKWLQADGTWGNWTQHDVTLASPGAAATTWTHPFTAPAKGQYGFSVEAVDAAGNTSQRIWIRFDVSSGATTPPPPPPPPAASAPVTVRQATYNLLGYLWSDGFFVDGAFNFFTAENAIADRFRTDLEMAGVKYTYSKGRQHRFRLAPVAPFDHYWKTGVPDELAAGVATSDDLRFFLAATLEGEGSPNGKVFDDGNWGRTSALVEVYARAGVVVKPDKGPSAQYWNTFVDPGASKAVYKGYIDIIRSWPCAAWGRVPAYR